MKIRIAKSISIKNLSDWFRFAAPTGGEKQWKEGRSAFELASFALSEKFAEKIQDLLNSLELPCPEEFRCEPEAKTCFPSKLMGRGGARNHDLLMVSDNLLIAIEAKVSESFDNKIEDKMREASDNLKKRVKGFSDLLYGHNPPSCLNELRYQLFSATVGTIIEAKSQNIHNCIMLVIVFKGNVKKEKEYEDKIKRNDRDFKNFCKSLSLPDTGGLIRIDGINCWIKKLEVILP